MGFVQNYMAAKQQARMDEAAWEAKQRKKFNGAISKMMLDNSFQGQFQSTVDGLEFSSIPGGNFTAFPSAIESYNKYKRIARQYSQEPDYQEFMGYYKTAEGQYGNALKGKFDSMLRAGHKKEAISKAIMSNPDLTKSFNHFLGTAIGDKLTPYAPEAPGGILGGMKDAFSFTSAATLGAKGAGIARLGALKGGVSTIGGRLIGKGMDATRALDAAKKLSGTEMKGVIDVLKGSGDDILKSTSKGKGIKTLKPALEKYIKKHGVAKLLKQMGKKAGLTGAIKILGKGILGTGLTATGLGTGVGLALDAMTIYEIANLVQEVTSEMDKGDTLSESILGGTVKAPTGTVY